MKIDGYTNMEIINDIRQIGYTGGNTQAYQYLSFLKETNGVTTLNYVEQRKQPIPYIKRLRSRKLAKYVGHSLNHIEDIDHRSYMEVLFDNMPILKRVRRLVKRFKKMLKTGGRADSEMDQINRGIQRQSTWIKDFCQRTKT